MVRPEPSMTVRFAPFATSGKRTSALGLAVAVAVAACGGSGSSEGAAGSTGLGGSSAGSTSSGSSGVGVTGGSGGATVGGSAVGGSSVAGTAVGGTAAGGTAAGGTAAGGTAVGGAGGGMAGTGGMGGAMAGSSGTGGAATMPAFDADAVKAIMRRVADYEITRFGTDNDNGWVRAAFHPGMLAAFRVLGDAKYHDYTQNWGTVNNWKLKDSSTDPACLGPTRTTCGARFADNEACVQAYAELYLAAPTAQNAVMLTAAQTTFDSMVAAPRTGRVEWWWEDALFMAPPALARVAAAVPAKSEQYLSLMDSMFWDTKAFLFDPAQGLFWRDSGYLNTNTYWSRGNGWVVAGTARILDVLPAADARRSKYEALLKTMATKLASVQAADGYWRSSLTQPNAFKDPETSGTAFFTFGIAWGINHGVLDRATFLPVVTKAWPALVKAVSAQGRLGYVQAVGAEPGPSTADNTNDYATGAFLLTGEQLLKL